MGQEAWLAGRPLRWSRWVPHRPGWDHDHCAFCHAEIAAENAEHVPFTSGYVTADDGYTWICQQCFDDFKDQFSWQVLPTTDQS
jgi:hypothetical protein